MLLIDFVGVYCSRRLTLKKTTERLYRSHISTLCNWSLESRGMAMRTEDLTLGLVEDFLSDMRTKEKWMPRTLNTCRSSINAVWNGAIRDKIADVTNNRLVCSASVPRRVPIAWSMDELTRLLKHAGSLRGRRKNRYQTRRRDFWLSLYLFLYESAARFSAAILLRPSDVDFRRRLVKLSFENSKTTSDHLATISERTAGMLRSVIDDHHERGVWVDGEEPLIWPSGRFGKNELYRQHREFLRKCGLTCDRYHMFHCFRRTCATQLTIASSIEEASKALNHASVAVTRRSYVDWSQLSHVDTSALLPSPFASDHDQDPFPSTIKFGRLG